VTLSGGEGKVKKMLQGGGKGLAKVLRDIFSKTFDYIFVFWPAFLNEKGYYFGRQKRHVTPRGGAEGGQLQCHRMARGYVRGV